jgi:hypothetical protein
MRARNQHPKRLPHLAHSQRCLRSASCTAGHANSDTSASQRIREGTSLSAAMPDDRFRPLAEIRLRVLNDGNWNEADNDAFESRPKVDSGPSGFPSARSKTSRFHAAIHSRCLAVAVGKRITPRPPHRSVRAALPHTAPALGHDAKAA